MGQSQRILRCRIGIGQAVAQSKLFEIAAQNQAFPRLRPAGRCHLDSALIQTVDKLIRSQIAGFLANRRLPGIDRTLERNLESVSIFKLLSGDIRPVIVTFRSVKGDGNFASSLGHY